MKLDAFFIARPSSDNKYDLVHGNANSFSDNHRDAIARFLQDNEEYLQDGWAAAKKDGYVLATLSINTNDPTKIVTTITYMVGDQRYTISADSNVVTSRRKAFL